MIETRTALVWRERLERDRAHADRCQSAEQRAITAELLGRAVEGGALAVALTGSAVRSQRTSISDLDYHVVGQRPDVRGFPEEVDVVADSRERLERRLTEGDDFVHWTVRHGCVLAPSERADGGWSAALRTAARSRWRASTCTSFAATGYASKTRTRAG